MAVKSLMNKTNNSGPIIDSMGNLHFTLAKRKTLFLSTTLVIWIWLFRYDVINYSAVSQTL